MRAKPDPRPWRIRHFSCAPSPASRAFRSAALSSWRRFAGWPRRGLAGILARRHDAREMQAQLQAGRIVEHLDARPVQARDRGDEAQPEPVAGRAAAAFEPIEALEYVGEFA